jgi:hypothetical protein
MAYFSVFLLSIISCFIGFGLSSVNGNICHVKNGRTPNAGASIFPTIPIIPIVYLTVTWGLNRAYEDLGFIVISTYACGSILLGFILLKKGNTKLHSLILESKLTNLDLKDSGDKL